MSAKTVYECNYDRCPLGSREDPGYFTDGLTEAGRDVLGLAADAPVGEGVCPNCGTPGKKAGTFEPLKGSDPYQKLHDEVAAEVADPENSLTEKGAQKALLAKIAEKEGGSDA